LNESDFLMADIIKYIVWNHCAHSAVAMLNVLHSAVAMLNVFIVFL